MLNDWMYQGYRSFSHSGTCITTPSSAICPGGRSMAAGIRNTHEVWNEESRAVRTVNVCEAEAPTARTKNVDQLELSPPILSTKGTATHIAAMPTATPYTAADAGSPRWRRGSSTVLTRRSVGM